MKSRKTKIFGLVLAASIAFCLVGCSEELTVPEIADVTEDLLVIDESGMVTSYVVADFDKDYYVEEELVEMILEELATFNKELKGFVKSDVAPAILSDTHRFDGKIIVEYIFANGYVYGQYQLDKLDCFTGTVEEAIRKGYLDSAKILSVKKGIEIDVTTNEKILNRQIVIWQGGVPVFVLAKPEYLSANVTLSEDMHTLKIQGTDGEYGFCIMK